MTKLLSVLAVSSCIFGSAALADGPGGAMFAARGSETQKLTIGGYIQTSYQWIDVNDEMNGHCDPQEYNNFLMSHIRLFVKAELGCGWSALMNVDFAGAADRCMSDHTWTTSEAYTGMNVPSFVNPERKNTGTDADGGNSLIRSCECKDQCKVFVDRAYIQKVWLDATFRFGYQKVSWGAEENTPEAHLKTIERSIATNFFGNLGRRVNGGNHQAVENATHVVTTYAKPSWLWVGQQIGGRHVGIFAAGQVCNFHYSAALTNGYQGLCMNSTGFNNELNFYGSIAMEFGIDCIDFLAGVNFAYSPKGSNADFAVNHEIYGFNPYALVNWNRVSVLGEFFWATVCDALVCKDSGNAQPWGFNLIPSFMFNDRLELVGRFSYVNSDELGMTIHNSFGCAPDDGDTGSFGAPNATMISSNTLFEKAYAGYVGVNYYMLNGAVKASFGLEQAKFKNRGTTVVGGANNGANSVKFGDSAGREIGKGAKVNAVRAAIQVIF